MWELPVPKASQKILKYVVQQLFPSEGTFSMPTERLKVICEDFIHPKMIFSITERNMQLDLFLPTLSLAFEYPCILQPLVTPAYIKGSSIIMIATYLGHPCSRTKNEIERNSLLANSRVSIPLFLVELTSLHITLIIVPYWWNKHSDSLAATIKQVRPDLIHTDVPLSRALKQPHHKSST